MRRSLFSDESARLLGLLIITIVFLASAVGGCVAAIYTVPEDVLLEYMDTYINEQVGMTGINWWGAAVNAFLYPCLVFLLGFTLLGVVLIPVAVAARGFFLSFAVTVFVRVYGVQGILFALGAQGIPSLLSLPCLFFLAAFSFDSARRLAMLSGGAKTGGVLFGVPCFARFAMCAAVLTAVAAYDALLSNRVINYLASFVL